LKLKVFTALLIVSNLIFVYLTWFYKHNMDVGRSLHKFQNGRLFLTTQVTFPNGVRNKIYLDGAFYFKEQCESEAESLTKSDPYLLKSVWSCESP
jgi:hypothetical protein